MANKLTPETMLLLKSESSYDWMTFVRDYCTAYKYRIRWNTALSKQIYPQLRAIISKKLLSGNKLYEALKYHCKSPHYLRILVRKGNRYNINGKVDGKVTSDEGNFAWKELCSHHSGAAKELRKMHQQKKVIVVNKQSTKEPEGIGQDKPKRVFKFNPR